jgi:hypothetical protein
VTRHTLAALILLPAAIALALTIAQGPFDESSFAFQQYRGYSGTVFTTTAPVLATASGDFLLTRPGKFRAPVETWRGLSVTLRGALIHSGSTSMLEIEPGSIHPSEASPLPPANIEHLGPIELAGEIADGKCYFGVMNPGRGKVHRDCAVRCLSGGAPPVFLVRDSSGRIRVLLLSGLGREILGYVAEPVRIRGELRRVRGQLTLHAASLRRE